MGSKVYLGFSPLQCQDLLSQTSSPLSQNDSCTGRSADLLLPPGDTGRRRHDSLHDPAAPSRAERFRIQVGQEGSCERESPDPSTAPVSQRQQQEEDPPTTPTPPPHHCLASPPPTPPQ